MTTTDSIEHARAARAAYIRDYRRRRPATHKRHVAIQNARAKALRRLAALHPQDMKLLYDEELRAIGQALTRGTT